MGDWIEREAEKHRKEQEAREEWQFAVSFSNYWECIRHQVEKDIARINGEPVWKNKLLVPIEIIDVGSGYYEIRKESFPAVNILVSESARKVHLKFTSKKDHFSKPSERKESLAVALEDRRIHLTRRDKSFRVPEEASEHILTPIMDALKS